MEIPQVVAISTGDHKLAALFFDLVVPTHSAGTVPEEIRYRHHGKLKLPYDVLADLIGELSPSPSARSDKEVRLRAAQEVDDTWAARLHTFFSEHGVPSVPLFTLPESYEQYNSPGDQYGLECTLNNVPIVSTSEMDWPHVLDVREDDDFRQKAQALRLFLAKEYQGKSKAFILDDISRRIQEYEESCKRHSLSVVISTLAKTLDSKSALGVAGVVAAGILTGTPPDLTLGALTGVAVEIGSTVLRICEKRLERTPSTDTTAISYLIGIQEAGK